MKPHLQCAEQQVSRSNLTKYCACHAERLAYLVLITYETSFTMRRATGVTIQPHQILCLSRRKTHILSPHHIRNIIYSARSTRCHDPTSPNTAPATKNDSYAWSSLHMKPHFQCAEQQVSLSNLTKYCACHAKWPLNIWQKFAENRWNVISNAGTIREWSENDPRMIREWSDHENANRNPPRKWGYFSSSPGTFSVVKYNVSSPILHSNIHQVLRLPQKVTLDLHQILPLPRKVTLELHQILPLPRKVTLDLHQVLHLPRKVTLDLHQVLRIPQKVTRIVHPRDIWNLIYNARSNQCHPPNSPNTAPATQIDHLTSGRNLRKTGETSFPTRGRSENDPRMIWEWSENDPRMIQEWSDHENANRNPPRKWGYFSSSPGTFSVVKYNVSSPILHSNIHQVLRLPQKVTLDLHQILPLPRKVTLELHQILPLPRKVTLDLHQVLHLPRKVTFELHLLYYSTLLDATLFDSTLLDSTLLDSTLLDSSPLDLLYLILLYLTPLYLTLLYLTLLYLTLLYLTLLYLTYSTWLYSTWHYSTWHYSTWLWLYSTWHYSTWHYSTWLWLYSTWHCSTWHYSTWLYST